MGFEPWSLVLPRMLALILIMPLLCLYADLMGIVGGALVTVSFFDVAGGIPQPHCNAIHIRISLSVSSNARYSAY
jgi:hypothetical protein